MPALMALIHVMKAKIIWVLVSCLMVVALVLSSCAAPAEEGAGKVITGKVAEKEVPGERRRRLKSKTGSRRILP